MRTTGRKTRKQMAVTALDGGVKSEEASKKPLKASNAISTLTDHLKDLSFVSTLLDSFST